MSEIFVSSMVLWHFFIWWC